MYFTPAEAAKKLGVCKVTILRRIRDGSIKASKLTATTIRIEADELNRYMMSKRS